MRTIDDLLAAQGDLRGRRVLVRSDLNVPLDGARITDDGRVRASLPTWQRLLDAGARVVVCAHLGRPRGAPEERYSLRPVHARIAELLAGTTARFAEDTVGPSARAAAQALGDGELLLVENLRFDARETSEDDAERGALADELAALVGGADGGGLYVSDGFGVVHRKQASVYDVAQRLPHAAGDLVLAETRVLRRLVEDPQRPYAVVLGGAKVSDKLGVIENLLRTCDRLLVGGGMVFTFLAAQGHEVGRSLLEADQVEAVRRSLDAAAERGVEVVLPVDVVAATAFSADADHEVVGVEAIPADRMGLDIGPRSATLFAQRLADARTVFWNGPMGAFEMAPYAEGTRAVAQALTEVTARGGLTVVGGGDSAAAVRGLGFAEDAFGHISTGGGASLELLEGEALPGLTVLERPRSPRWPARP
ncbi:phosphoglycerate kinase [Quadrisphaera sp. DSM 44207]|uniref:phosphoglycerate kinase n=1 Tax=Quadrisphaera sp. DSM 44207 TaxID=1881057 RepID=UPI00088A76DB|nr:phosphoglycerate kinase [Quadrisphaera sp. DSM 44207]SDQ44369.1 phosphoglycerate kinase [Quadrisphaera sp. DSM 44207]